MKLKEVIEEELKRIVPSGKEIDEMEERSNNFISVLEKKNLIAFVGGSLAKGTVVKKKKQDIDIFVVFDYSEEIFKLESVLKKVKLPGKLRKVHGSRDYFQVDCGDLVFEVIPVVRNEDPELAENVTDVSLSHVKYVKSELDEDSRLADEIRLAKAFCQAQRCYGAESYVRGFSGYSLEVLVIYFGGFVKFLKGISKKRVIDSLKQFRNEAEIRREINSSKIQGPVIVVDPTFKYRNVTAGLSKETFEKFLKVSQEFLKNPSPEFFERKEVDIVRLRSLAKKKKAGFFEIDLETDRQEGDIAGTKMKKFFDFFVRELERKQQKVLKKEFDYFGIGKKAKGYLVLKEIPEIEVRGPADGLEEAVVKFKKARRGAYRKKGYWRAKEKVLIKDVFDKVNRIGGEMGAWGKMKFS